MLMLVAAKLDEAIHLCPGSLCACVFVCVCTEIYMCAYMAVCTCSYSCVCMNIIASVSWTLEPKALLASAAPQHTAAWAVFTVFLTNLLF